MDHPGSKFGEDADKYIAAAGHYGNKSATLVEHYSRDLGFDYLTASNKEEFLNNMHSFVAPNQSKNPLLFEVFTQTDCEIKALNKMRHIVTDTKRALKHNVKKIAKEVVGKFK